jgi:hypothetical protein
VLLLALLAESTVNPLYEWAAGHKLWVYRLHPLHEGNVSMLGAMVWSAYGVHLYFTHQMLGHRLLGRWDNRIMHSVVLALEAPLFCEVTGNLTFLLLTGRYYAYYLPGDLGHFTSIQVIPIYGLSFFLGLGVLDALKRMPRSRRVPALLFAGGCGWLFAG